MAEIKDGMILFWGEGIYTNFYPVKYTYKGHTVYSSEQCYMLEKAWMFEPSKADDILATREPMAAKRLGRKIKNYDDAKWAEVRYAKMVEVLMVKFSIPEFKKQLLATGDRMLVEASPYDRIWGVGLSEDDSRIHDPKQWRGQNLLGQALMEVRDKLRSQTGTKGE